MVRNCSFSRLKFASAYSPRFLDSPRDLLRATVRSGNPYMLCPYREEKKIPPMSFRNARPKGRKHGLRRSPLGNSATATIYMPYVPRALAQ